MVIIADLVGTRKKVSLAQILQMVEAGAFSASATKPVANASYVLCKYAALSAGFLRHPLATETMPSL